MAKYTAVVLTEESRSALRQQFRSELPPAWRIEADQGGLFSPAQLIGQSLGFQQVVRR